MYAKGSFFLIALLSLALIAPAGAMPPVQSWQTANGAKVFFLPAPDLPMLDVRVVFHGGSAWDGGQPGLAVLTANLLTQGAGPWDADQLAERLEGLGADLSTGALRDMAYVALRCLTQPQVLNQAVETLATVLAEPRFQPDDFERVRRNTLIGLRLEAQDPGALGKKALYRGIYGNHPYGSHPRGTPESLQALTRADLSAFHRRIYVARNAVLALVGAVDRQEAERLAEKILFGLPEGQPAPALPPVPDLTEPVVQKIPFPSTQTHIYAGQPGIRRDDPDYFPLYVGNHILGGSGLVSRLMKRVREEQGLSYSVSSAFIPMAQRGPFLMALSTKNDRAEEARSLMMETLRRFRDQGPTREELDAAKKNLTGGFPLRIASNRDLVLYLAMMGFYDLPSDYLETFRQRVSEVTVRGIRDAFQRHLDPDRFVTILVGPEAGDTE